MEGFNEVKITPFFSTLLGPVFCVGYASFWYDIAFADTAADPFSAHTLSSMFPELLLSLVLLVLVSVLPTTFVTRNEVRMALLFVGFCCIGWFFWISSNGEPSSFSGVYVLNTFSKDLRFILFFCFSVLLILDGALIHTGKIGLVLFGFTFLGMMLLVCAEDFFFLFLAAELTSLASCFLVALPSTRYSTEAAIKYFATGIFSASLFLFGVLIFFFIHESVSADPGVRLVYPLKMFTCYHGRYWIGSLVTFLVGSLLVKVGAAPFYYWVPDVYEGCGRLPLLVLSVISKLIIFFVLARVLFFSLGAYAEVWRPLLSWVAGTSIVIGGLGALFQRRVKRLLAYSSISNVGYALGGLSAGSEHGLQAAITHMIFYAVSLFILLILLYSCTNQAGMPALIYISDFAGLVWASSTPIPFLFCLVLFSLAGIPPLAGFWTKLYILEAMLGDDLSFLVLVGVVFGVINSFYYINLVRILCFEGSRLEFIARNNFVYFVCFGAGNYKQPLFTHWAGVRKLVLCALCPSILFFIIIPWHINWWANYAAIAVEFSRC